MPFPLSSQFSGTPIEWGNFTHRYEFTIDLTMPVTDAVSFMGTVPMQQRSFSNGGQSLYDPENIGGSSSSGMTTCGSTDAFNCLLQRTPLNGQIWQNQGRPYTADSLHGRYPLANGQMLTVSVANLTVIDGEREKVLWRVYD